MPRAPGSDPIRSAFDVQAQPETIDAVNAALDAIDSVHGITAPPSSIPLRQIDSSQYDAWYDPRASDRHIGVSRLTSVPGTATLHEIAHYIDHQLIGAPDAFASPGSELAEWRLAVEQSDLVARLVDMFLNPDDYEQVLPGGVVWLPDPPAIGYYLEVEELFARSYTQWIVIRSGNKGLRDELARSASIPYPEVWEDADFRPIADAFDRLFERLGWRTT